jgi:hypothetical protein
LFLISGVIFLYEDMPAFAQDIIWYNPLMHLTGLMREGFYPLYRPTYISLGYVALCVMAPMVLGLLLLLRRQRQRMVVSNDAGLVVGPEQVVVLQQLLSTMGIVLLAMLLALVQEFGVAQNIVTARASGGNLRLWHSVGSLMVLGQWLCAGAVLWRLSRSSEAFVGAQ